ncbi:Sodium/hydrogen exchanger family-domain-containing protein [Aspergillus coremiiformis]|uniref:Sodium/hydrogen exchanger n=1 Tax=Aspergillus coremiiformis TaxID=138285 RepID=A0A5N6ZD06_9EURO|nr:Sodium/hydrogen exchanger family-domain-containing protein [Aspergillus coremiiformis]
MTETDERVANETSPLVESDNDSNNVDSIAGQEVQDYLGAERTGHLSETKSSWYLFLLTLSIGGLQIVWSVELSNGSPYLLSLGMSKALLAFVWIAGPLTGTLVQPYIGICSDNCRSSWGKRKPFMVVGGLATVVALLALAWVNELVGGFLGIFGIDQASTGTRTTIIVFATILMYCLDFAINTVQAGIRCFIVDNAPAHQQESANSWASRLTGVGNILGYIFGYMDLPRCLPFLGNTQFKVLCALASLSLVITLLISCLYIQERDPRLDPCVSTGNPGVVAFFKQVFKSIQYLPPQIAKVCEVQLAAWIGWFPFLFYATTYIGQLYVNPIFDEHPNLSDNEIDKAWEKATRIGTFALLVYAIISFVANITLPMFIVPTYQPDVSSEETNNPSGDERPFLGTRSLSWSTLPVGTPSEPPPTLPDKKTVEAADRSSWVSKLQIPGLTLRRAWALSHVLFALCMFSTFFIYSHQAGTVVIAIVGICWALTLWAPFALISAEVARIDAERRIQRYRSEVAGPTIPNSAGNSAQPYSITRHDDLEDGLSSPRKAMTEEENLAQAGIILGLHNVAVSSPQILSSLICSVIFKMSQKPRGEPWDDSVGWTLRFGGCAAVLAAWLTRRAADSESDPDEDAPEAGTKEFFSSWALFILIMLLMFALFTSYILQQKKIQAVHETVLSIFAGMFVGLIIRLSPESPIQDSVTFDYQFFFNLLLPPIILASGYELHQANFFRNIGTILTFAFAGTFISAIVLGLVLFLWTRIPLDGLNITFVEAISVGATLSATDPVTILAIFNLYKVEPKLYTVIFGESILNDAIAIVLFDTAQKYADSDAGSLTVLNLFEAIGLFLLAFFGSMVVGMIVGIMTALGLKHTHVRRMPKIESCLIVLIAYASYFFSNGVHLSGIVSLLFCGITLKHYAYYNMSRRTQLTTKYLFQVMAQLSENFIFIYLGLDLLVQRNLQFKPLFIMVAVFGICLARYLAVFPLSKAINWFIRYRARRRGMEVADELPFAYQAMLFWAGLRGAVGVALAAGLTGVNAPALRATVLVVVVLTVIIFGGTTARMLEILGIRTGVVEELESDDEFDIEVTNGGTYYKRSDTALGYTPRRMDSTIPLDGVQRAEVDRNDSYSSGNSRRPSPPPSSSGKGRRHSRLYSNAYSPRDTQTARDRSSTATLLGGGGGGGGGGGAGSHSDSSAGSEDEFGLRSHGKGRATDAGHVDAFDIDVDEALSDDDLPPSAPTASRLRRSPSQPPQSLGPSQAPPSANASPSRRETGRSAGQAIRDLFSGGSSGDHGAWFRQLDEDYIKPRLLLDQSNHKGPGAV